MLIDTHCHIYNQYYDNIDKIMEKIKKSGVLRIINTACNYDTCIEVKQLSEIYEDMYYVLGLHPEENLKEIDKIVMLIRDSISNNKFLGIGEIGLDYHYSKDNRHEQIEIFKEQLDLASEFDLPVIIHSREATKDTLDILKQYKLKGIIHCFNGSVETAKEYIKLGFKLGINGVVTFKNCKLIEVLRQLSINDIVFETDSPYLAPVPFRGHLNDSSYVNNIVDFVSGNLNIDRETLIKISYKNIDYVFNKKI